MTDRHLADRVLPVLVVAIAALGVVATATRLPYFSYDEGVYFHMSAEWARGRVPYTGFFVPQPPGIISLGFVAEKLGLGIGGVRAVTVLCGLLLLYQAYRLGRRISGPVGWASAGLLASSAEWTYTSLEAATQTPTAVLILLAVELVLNRRIGWAGVIVGLATVFRIQALTLLPGLGLAVGIQNGWRAGVTGNLKLTSALLTAGTIHGLLCALIPGYWDGVFGFQFDRPRMTWTTRSEILSEILAQPAVLLGVFAALALMFRSGEMRAVSVVALTTTAVTVFAGNSLFRPYFLPVLPLLAVNLAALANDWLARFRYPPRCWAVVAVLTVTSGVSAIRVHSEADRNRQSHELFLTAIRETPGDVWLTTDGRLLELCGKRMVPDFLATDPGGLFVRDPARFQTWFRDQLQYCDAIAVTDLLAAIVDDETSKAILQSGKPVVYESDTRRPPTR